MSSSSTIAIIDGLQDEVHSGTLNLCHARNILLIIVVVATALQLLVSFSIVNLEMSALLLFSAWIGITYAFKKDLLTLYPISTLMLLGYIVYRFVIPPIGQLSELHGITYQLRYPIWVEVYDFSGLISLLAAHVIYRKVSLFSGLRRLLSLKFYTPLGFFLIPETAEYWLLGLVGIIATVVSTHYNVSSNNGGTERAVLRVFAPLIYMPYLMVFEALADPSHAKSRSARWIPLGIYTIVAMAASLVTNSRGFILAGLASLALAYIYRVLSGTLPAPRVTLKTLIIIVCIVLFVTGPVTNMAASMLIVRSSRAEISKIDLIKETWKIYESGTAVKIYDEATAANNLSSGYNEAYYNNIFLNRLGNLMFDDLSIRAEKGSKLVGDIGYFRQLEYDKCLALLPLPAIKALGLNVNKAKVLSGSSEDFLYEESTGYPVGGFKLGSLVVILHATFGLIWPLVLIAGATLMFVLGDALCLLRSIRDHWGAKSLAVLSPFAVVTLFQYVFFFSGGGVFDLPGLLASLTRSWIQTGILYGVVYFLIRRFSRTFLLTRG